MVVSRRHSEVVVDTNERVAATPVVGRLGYARHALTAERVFHVLFVAMVRVNNICGL